MISRFFVHRPIFAWVISIAIMLAGVTSIFTLPVSQYPNVAPPSVNIQATYTGASAETVENSVTQIIEQQLTGLDGLLYFSSTSSSDGRSSIDVTFELGTDADTAQMQVQNKVSQAESQLPTSVQQTGITITKRQNDFLLIAALYDQTDRDTNNDISDYLVSSMQDSVSRIDGVGSVQIFGAEYAMRIWMDPNKLKAYKLMPSDISSALEAQNVQVAAGQVGGLPSVSGQQINATISAQSKLQTPEQFRNIIVKDNQNGAVVHLSDVARVELGSESYDIQSRVNGHPASGMAVMLAPGANALDTADRVKTTLNQLKPNFPDGYELAYPVDTTDIIKISIEEVVKTLFEAIALVVVVMFIFLQNWRATLIPAIAVPVVLLGTFGILELFGYSINTLTMFALVLSIGLLVDDAIVVVENVERIMREDRLGAREATLKSMGEITSALIGVTTVLTAVFLPMAFFSGTTGVIYRQFSITIVSSMLLSIIVALTLTPALCAALLKPHDHESGTRGFFGWFNRNFDSMTSRYRSGVAGVLKTPVRWLLCYGLIVAALAMLMIRLPTGFLPNEDQGRVMVQFTLPSGASMDRTEEVAAKVLEHFQTTEKDNIDKVFTLSGFGFNGTGQNNGMGFVSLKDWDAREGEENSADAIAMRAMMSLSKVRDAQIFALTPPPIMGMGQTNGFEFHLQAAPGTERSELKTLRDTLLNQANQDKNLSAVRLGALAETPELKVDIDQQKAASLGLSLSDVSTTLSSALAGSYVNDFVDRGRVKKVYIQGDAQYRSKPDDINSWYVRGDNSDMVPFSAFSSSHWTYGPTNLTRFNGLASYEFQGSGATGVSSGSAMQEIASLAGKLPSGSMYSWGGLSYQEQLSSGQTTMLYGISILVVFLCLAALYESWSVPFSVMLVIPLGVFGAAAAATLRGLENDVYFQVALLTIIGLSSKNAILIVEFAEDAYNRGKSAFDAAIEGAKLRFRPILMTSLAFIVGTLPLALSTGAGANSRISIGTGIVGGTLSATILAIFLVPLFFVVVRKIFSKRRELHHS